MNINRIKTIFFVIILMLTIEGCSTANCEGEEYNFYLTNEEKDKIAYNLGETFSFVSNSRDSSTFYVKTFINPQSFDNEYLGGNPDCPSYNRYEKYNLPLGQADTRQTLNISEFCTFSENHHLSIQINELNSVSRTFDFHLKDLNDSLYKDTISIDGRLFYGITSLRKS